MGAFGTPVIISRTHVADSVSGPVVTERTALSSNLEARLGIMDSSRMMFSPTPSRITRRKPSLVDAIPSGKATVEVGWSGSNNT